MLAVIKFMKWMKKILKNTVSTPIMISNTNINFKLKEYCDLDGICSGFFVEKCFAANVRA
jgi:hypothetical protein